MNTRDFEELFTIISPLGGEKSVPFIITNQDLIKVTRDLK